MPATATLTDQIYTEGLTFYSKNTSQEGLAAKWDTSTEQQKHSSGHCTIQWQISEMITGFRNDKMTYFCLCVGNSPQFSTNNFFFKYFIVFVWSNFQVLHSICMI